MPTLLLRFPARRYHATPWGHHVNEGLIEWPPSPWRLLRSLLATGYTKLHWPGDGPPPTARSLIEKLAAVLPCYRLPEAVGTHSRHYMPLARFKKGREDTTLVFDTWAQVDHGALVVRWDVDLSAEESALLAALARHLGYLGRSESWVDAELVDDEDSQVFEVRPGEARDHPGFGWEQVQVLAPTSAAEYAAWRKTGVAEARAQTGVDLAKKKHTRAEQRKLDGAEAAYPVDLIACLLVETGWLHKLGWSQPPGSYKVLYWRRRDTLESAAPRPKRRLVKSVPVDCMLLSMATSSGNEHALPTITRVLPQAELLHRALNAHAARIARHSVALSGCDTDGKPLAEGHRHAHLLHLDLDGDDHLDHVLIWAPMGLDGTAQAAIRAVRRTFTKGGTAPLRLAVAAIGALADLARLPAPYGDRLAALSGTATRWRSLTPFVPPRFLKKRGANTLKGQVAAELEARGLPEPESVTVLDPRHDEQARASRHIIRTRRVGPPPPLDWGFVLELTFSESVRGPLVLGYGCHFGLGVFMGIDGVHP